MKYSVFALGLLAALSVSAEDQLPNIYPFVPIPSSDIIEKTMRLSEDKNAIVNIMEVERYGLSQGRTKNAPWSGPFWALKQGMIANNYQDKTAFQYFQVIPGVDSIKPYDKRENMVLSKFYKMSEKELAKLAPSEKYDILVSGGQNLDLSNQIWDFINKWKNDMKFDFMTSIDLPGDEYELKKSNYTVANWEGICHGWAPASGIVPKPRRTVNITLPDGRNLPFYPEDIKGLVSLTWANSLVQDRVISEGLRCKRRNPKRDKFGRYYDTIPEADGTILPACADVHPAIMYLTLVNVTGKQGRSFVIDKAATIAVANQPVSDYKFQYFHPKTGVSTTLRNGLVPYSQYRAFDPFASARSPQTAYVIGVDTTLSYADWTLIKNPSKNDKDNEKDSYKDIHFRFDLEIDANGTIVGGQWRVNRDPFAPIGKEMEGSEEEVGKSLSSTHQPDFLWVIPKDYKKDFQSVPLPRWSVTSAQPAPQEWTNAAKAAHSFLYHKTKEYGTAQQCKVKNKVTKEIELVDCEFKEPRPQPLIQVVDQLVELAK